MTDSRAYERVARIPEQARTQAGSGGGGAS